MDECRYCGSDVEYVGDTTGGKVICKKTGSTLRDKI